MLNAQKKESMEIKISLKQSKDVKTLKREENDRIDNLIREIKEKKYLQHS